ncbi:MAG: hypothetical protein ABFD07_04805 [Methanobacterium sp.]
MEENTYRCRRCNGLGTILYYFPINKVGPCPHCGGKGLLDWIKNIKGCGIKIDPPKLTEREKETIENINSYMRKYAEKMVSDLKENCIVNKMFRLKGIKDESDWRKYF